MMATEAISRSRRCLPCFITMPTSQRRVNGGSASACERSARSRMASPLQTSLSRISSTGTGGSASGARGSRMKTILLSGLEPVSRPAGSVVEQQHDRAGAGDGEQMPPAQPQRPRPHAGVLRPGRTAPRRWALSRPGPAGIRRIEFQAIIARRHHHREQTRMDRTTPPPLAATGMPAPAVPPPPGSLAKRSRARGCSRAVRACVRQIYPRANPFSGVSGQR